MLHNYIVLAQLRYLERTYKYYQTLKWYRKLSQLKFYYKFQYVLSAHRIHLYSPQYVGRYQPLERLVLSSMHA